MTLACEIWPSAAVAQMLALAEDSGHMVCLVPPDNAAGRLYRYFHRRHGFDITLFSREQFTRMAGDAGWKVDACRSVFPYALVFQLDAS